MAFKRLHTKQIITLTPHGRLLIPQGIIDKRSMGYPEYLDVYHDDKNSLLFGLIFTANYDYMSLPIHGDKLGTPYVDFNHCLNHLSLNLPKKSQYFDYIWDGKFLKFDLNDNQIK